MHLEIVVSPSCWSCEEAREIAVEMGARFRWLAIEVIEIGGPRPVPREVFATPTYLLDGAVISLGNPTRDQLARTIEARGREHHRRSPAT